MNGADSESLSTIEAPLQINHYSEALDVLLGIKRAADLSSDPSFVG
jgi:hypothetical protein